MKIIMEVDFDDTSEVISVSATIEGKLFRRITPKVHCTRRLSVAQIRRESTMLAGEAVRYILRDYFHWKDHQ